MAEFVAYESDAVLCIVVEFAGAAIGSERKCLVVHADRKPVDALFGPDGVGVVMFGVILPVPCIDEENEVDDAVAVIVEVAPRRVGGGHCQLTCLGIEGVDVHIMNTRIFAVVGIT